MGVTTNLINKPLNPRAQDASPLAYNRAALYSGKALSFDGVNDYVDCGTLDVTAYTAISMSFNFQLANITDNGLRLVSLLHSGTDDIRIEQGLSVLRITLDDGTAYTLQTPSLTANEWNKFDMTFNGSTLEGYINGVSIGSISASFNFSTANGLLNLYKHTAASSYAEGLMSGFKLFNTALTAAQVADLYNNPEKILPTGVDNTALKLWLPMMEGAGTTAYDGASLNTATERVENGDFSEGTTGWIGNPETTLSVTNGQLDIQSAATSQQYGSAFSEVNFTSGKYYLFQLDIVSCNNPSQIRIGASNSATLYSQNIWASGEIGVGTHSILWLAPSNYTYLSIGGRNDVTTLVIDNVSVKEVSIGDISGATWTHGIGAPVSQTSVVDWNKTILDKTNEVLIPQGLTTGRDLLGNLFENVRKQGALNLDGNSWAEVHDNASVDVQSFTLECWVNLEFNGTYQEFISKGDSSSDRTFELYLNNTEDRFGVLINTAGFSFATQTINENQWYHVVASYDSSNDAIKGYVDSVEKLSTTGSVNPNNTDADVVIGAWYDKSQLKTNGQIAQPRIYNRALTAEEVQRNFNAGKNIYS